MTNEIAFSLFLITNLLSRVRDSDVPCFCDRKTIAVFIIAAQLPEQVRKLWSIKQNDN